MRNSFLDDHKADLMLQLKFLLLHQISTEGLT